MLENEIISLFKTDKNKLIGDDVAFIKENNSWKALASDSMSEDIHFYQKWSSPEQLAKKLVSSNVSVNIISIRLADKIGIQTVIDYYAKFLNFNKSEIKRRVYPKNPKEIIKNYFEE